jgi:hypothetical protein
MAEGQLLLASTGMILSILVRGMTEPATRYQQAIPVPAMTLLVAGMVSGRE